MVEKMKKLHLLMTSEDSLSILADLQKIGVIHLVTGSVNDDSDLVALGTRINALKKIGKELTTYTGDEFSKPEPLESVLDVESLEIRVNERLAELARYKAELERLQKDIETLAPWGEFDPVLISRLQESGILISFHTLASKVFDTFDFGDRYIEVINRQKIRTFFVEIRRADTDGVLKDALLPGERLPQYGSAEILRHIEKATKAVSRLQSRLAGLSSNLNLIEGEISGLEHERERRVATLSLGEKADGEVMCLTGFIPVSILPDLEEFLDSRSILPIFTDPEQPSEAPVRLKNGPVARLFEPITKIFGLPEYVEIDTTPFFAPFFAFFFGLCLADVGYGIIVSVSALAGFFLLKKKALKSLAALGFILGLTTVVGGLFLNTLFGMKINGIPNLPTGISSMLLFQDINDAMAFSILLGVLQILLGFIMQIVNKWRQDGFAASLQPAGTFMLIVGVAIWAVGNMGDSFSVGPMSVGLWVGALGNTSGLGLGLAAVGILLIMFFNNPGKKIWIRPLLGLWEMYGIASGVPGDILSYIRLFALALAGGLLGGAINLIAIMIRGDNPGIFSWFFMILVLVGGHFINFALAALGAFVHPLRLTFVEFYKAVGFSGGGKPYTPYGGKTK